MYFKRIEMHGFKSFAEPVVIEFHEGVTCIVGPNGSGKSNISDAIRWVLGEQSPKMLRGGKMEEVIFAGTANRKSRGMAEVTLVIDNTTGILPIDYNEVAITRRMYRSGESEYLINNNQCRLRDIRELIMDTGIGVDGYSIIGQGKIADIVSNKPESRREIFEEAAGVVLYKSKKTEAERKLTSTSANLERVNDIVGEIEGRIDSLRDDSIKAKEYLELKSRYKELEINITLRNIEKLTAGNQTMEADIDQLAKSIEELNQSKASVDQNLASSRERSETLEKLSNEARDRLLEKVEEINRLTNKSQLNAERLATIDRDSARINEEIKSLNSKLIKELENSHQLESEKDEINVSLAGAQAELEEKISQFNSVTSKYAEMGQAIDDDRNRMYELHSQVSAKRSEAKSIVSYKESLEKRRIQLQQEQKEIEENAAAFDAAMKKLLEEKEEADKVLESLKAEIFSQTAEQQALNNTGKELLKKSEDIRIQGSQLTSRKKTIEEMENNYEGYNMAVRHIMKANLPGIEGVVAELMKVPAGYEVAIETALGGGLQNLVCRDDGHAKNAIKYLKENRAGRLTFLPMTSVKGNKPQVESKISKGAGYKGLAVDCIDFEGKYEGIFRYLLGRVVIVDNMDNAVALSKAAGNGLRFVTLEGEIINSGGAITGGKYKNNTANLLERKKEISQLEATIDNLRKEFETTKDKLEETEKQQAELFSTIAEKEEKKRQAELSSLNLKSRIEAMEESRKELGTSSAKKEREFSSVESDFANADLMSEELLLDALEGEAEINRLNDQIASAMAKYEEMKDLVDKANEEITQTRIAKTEWDNKADSLNQLLDRIKNTTDDLQTEIASKKEEITQLKTEKNGMLYTTDDAQQVVNTKTEEKNQIEEYIGKIKEEKELLSVQINSMADEQLSAGGKLNGLQDQKYQQEIKLAKNQTQLETFKERLWEEFEISYIQAIEFKKDDFVMSAATKESREIKERLRELGDVNVGSIKEYDQVSERYNFLTEQRGDILTAMEELQGIISDMDKTIKEKFKENFDQVVINFEGIFKELFGGGQAELRLDDEENPLEAGIEIVAQPPGKKLQNINLMSGGEKTMTAIALMFAVLKTKPTPFCILDEVEAALDDANIDRFAAYLRNFNDIQFAIVTHQKATMEHADVLYGVTMPEQGISKVLSLRLGDNFEI